MARLTTIILGHPDPAGHHFCHALASAYAAGVREAGGEVRIIDVAQLDFPLLRTQADFETGEPPASVAAAQEAIRWADHLVIIFPLWLGTMPALLKGFLEQVFRPGFATKARPRGWEALLEGRSARIIVTMGMPAFLYRWYFGAHGIRNLERGILGFSGIGPIRRTLIGTIGAIGEGKRKVWLERVQALGKRGQ